MKLRIVIILSFLWVLLGCSSNRKVVSKKEVKKVRIEPKPIKTPSVNQLQHIRKLKRSGIPLNNYTLAYIRKYAPLAVLEMHEYKIPASITLAQGILESGSGRSELARKSNNHFGIKCHRGWKGKRVYHDDDKKGECFRKYQFVQSSYEDHSKFLTGRKRYASLFSLSLKNYKGWARGLKKAGYATDKRYPKKLIKVIEDYKLYEFDKVSKRDIKKYKKEGAEVLTISPKKNKKQKGKRKTYEVKKGDTLYSISKKFSTTVSKLKEVNGLKSNALSIGQLLYIE